MKPLLIVGAGSFAPEAEELARLCGYGDIAFLDDCPENARCRPVIGSTSDVPRFRDRYPHAIVALGNNENRLKYHNELLRCGYTVPTLIHPTAYVSPDARIGEGSIIRAKCVVSRYVKIGSACILNAGALIDHDVVLGDGCHILMGAVVRDMVELPPLTRVETLTVADKKGS